MRVSVQGKDHKIYSLGIPTEIGRELPPDALFRAELHEDGIYYKFVGTKDQVEDLPSGNKTGEDMAEWLGDVPDHLFGDERYEADLAEVIDQIRHNDIVGASRLDNEAPNYLDPEFDLMLVFDKKEAREALKRRVKVEQRDRQPHNGPGAKKQAA